MPAFPLPILHIKSHQIDEWLRKLGGAPRTLNTVHTSIRTFFSCAKARSCQGKRYKNVLFCLNMCY